MNQTVVSLNKMNTNLSITITKKRQQIKNTKNAVLHAVGNAINKTAI